MTKAFLGFAAFIVLGVSSCKSCVDCSGVATAYTGKVCKSDYQSGAGKADNAPPWSTYREALIAAGCKGE